MMARGGLRAVAIGLCLSLVAPIAGRAADGERGNVGAVVALSVQPAMTRYDIPGMAAGVVLNGQTYVFDFGVASRETGKPVTPATLFEIGSVSKTMTATLVAYLGQLGRLSLADPTEQYLPELRGSPFGGVRLLALGTHTAGGLPLQVPDGIANDQQLMAYLRDWKPACAVGLCRTYSNVGIGVLGLIAARRMNEDFAALMKRTLFARLEMTRSFLDVPDAEMVNYAQGYTQAGAPVRMASGELGVEAYGVRTTAGDLLRFVAANMGMLALDPTWRRAIRETHTGYFRLGAMTQDLIWEQYDDTALTPAVLEGNSDQMVQRPNRVLRLLPPQPPDDHVLINKTGSTNGFAAYVAFLPARKIGVVLLANKNYPISARVTAAMAILSELDR